MALDDIVDVSITTAVASISRKGFGTPMLAAYFPTSVFTPRIRTYNKLADMLSDGFESTDPAYLMAARLKSQNPSVKSWKIGRKANPSEQSIRLTPTSTTEGDVLSVTIEGNLISYPIPAGASVASICTDMAALINDIVGVSCSDDTTHMTITPNRVTSVRLTVTTQENSADFIVTIDGVDYTYTSDTSTSKTEIRDGLEALIDADIGADVTTTDNSTDALDIVFTDGHYGHEVTVTNPVTGVLTLSDEVSAYDLLSFGLASSGLKLEDLTPDPGLAADLAAIEAADNEWYGLLIDSNSKAEIAIAAAFAEARIMLFGASTVDTTVKDSGETTDIGSTLKDAGYARTFLIFSAISDQYAAAGWMGVGFPYDPGSITWAYKKLAGVTTVTLTGSEEAALNDKNVNHYQSISGAPITQKGYSSSGAYIDITHGVDWFRSRIQERFYGLLVANKKIPFTDASVDMVRAEIMAQLQEGVKKGLIAPDTVDQPHVVNAPTVAEVSAIDRANRLLPDIEFSAYLAGAIHTMQITGTLSV